MCIAEWALYLFLVLYPFLVHIVSLSGAGTFLMRVIELATNSSSFSLPYAFPLYYYSSSSFDEIKSYILIA